MATGTLVADEVTGGNFNCGIAGASSGECLLMWNGPDDLLAEPDLDPTGLGGLTMRINGNNLNDSGNSPKSAGILDITMSDALHIDNDSDALASPGDTLRYTVDIQNPDDPGDVDATGVEFYQFAIANTTLVTGSVTTSLGSVSFGNDPGDTDVAVAVGTITETFGATISFDVVIDEPLTVGVTQISAQGILNYDQGAGDIPTDDPDDATSETDPTLTDIAATGIGNLVWHDANNNGLYDSGTESGIDGVTLGLYRTGDDPGTDSPVVTDTTSGGGIYNLAQVANFEYFVYIATPPALYPTSSITTNTTNYDSTDNDDNGMQITAGGPVTSPLYIPQEITTTVDFGFFNDCVASVEVTTSNDSGAGSLRQAIMDVCPGGDITFDNDYTITLSSQLGISKSLTIDGSGKDIAVSGNDAVRVFDIAMAGTDVVISHTTVFSGLARAEVICGGGTCGGGILVRDEVTLTLNNSIVRDNNGGSEGGGIYNHGGTLIVDHSQIADNTAFDGGGIANNNAGNVAINSSTISGNRATAIYGGGIKNWLGGTIALVNSTVSGNHSQSIGGGGILNAATMVISNSTIAENTTAADGAAGLHGFLGSDVTALANTIIANNISMGSGATVSDCSNLATISVDVNNLIEDGTCGTPLLTVDPLLSPLQDNGGDTHTHALLPGSPAIDKGDSATCMAVGAVDQRDITRPMACDIGAFESQSFSFSASGGSGQSTLINTAFSDPLTLTVKSGFGEPVGPGGVIVFNAPLSGASITTQTITKTTDMNGNVSVMVNANGELGSYMVSAETVGAPLSTTYTLNNIGANNDPIAVDDTYNLEEDDLTTALDVTVNDSDPDGDAITITLVGATDNGGSAIINTIDDVISYTPAANFNGTETFTYTIEDGNGGDATAMVTVTLGAVNDDPVADDDTFSVPEDSPESSLDVLDNDSDVDGDTLSINAVGATNNGGSAVISGSEAISYTPAADFFGTETFTYTIDDGNGSEDTAMVTVTVTSVNDGPTANDDTYSVAEDAMTTDLKVLDNDFDPETDALTITLVGPTDNGGSAIIYATNRVISYTPAADFFGTETFTYTIEDIHGAADTAMVTVTVTAVNDDPMAMDDTFAVAEDSPETSLDVLDNDSDVDGDSLTINAVGATNNGGSAMIDTGAAISYTPAAAFVGTETFTYTIDDGNGGEDTALVTVNVGFVNTPPVAVDDTFSVAEDSMTSGLDVLANDSDPDGGAVTITLVGMTNNGGSALINSSDGVISYTPAADFNGMETFTYTITDAHNGEDSAMVTVTVTAVNDAPMAVDDTFSVEEDSADNALDVLDNDSDVDGDTLSITMVGATDNGGTVVISNSSTISYTPAASFVGTETFTYTIEDSTMLTDTAMVTVTVNRFNTDPIADDDTFMVMEDSMDNNLTVLDNDSDPEGDAITVTMVGMTSNGGSAMISNSTAISYTPAADFFGTETFTYTIEDGFGGMASAMVTVTVTAVNDAPMAVDDTFSVEEDSSNNMLDVLDNDNDVDGDSLTISMIGATDNGGNAMINGGVISYTPAADFFGTETFTYTIEDSGSLTDTAMVTVTVNRLNTAPVAADDTYTVTEDSPTTNFTVMNNDSDADGDTITVTMVGATDNGGSAAISGAGIDYTPAANFYGSETFTYTIEDGYGGMDTAIVNVNVSSVNDAPVAVADTYTTTENSAAISLDVLDNDSDVENDTLSISAVGATDNGGSAVISGSVISYTPAADFSGAETFTYTVSDGNGGMDTAIVSVNVSPSANNAPTFTSTPVTTIMETKVYTYNITTSDVDAGDVLTISVTSAPAWLSSFVDNGDGTATLSGTPQSSDVGDHNVTLSVTDGTDSTTQPFTISVTAMPRTYLPVITK